MSRLIEIAGPIGAIIVAIMERRFIASLCGTDWIAEPGIVWMASIDRGRRAGEWFYYTHWRERSMFRGKSYKDESKLDFPAGVDDDFRMQFCDKDGSRETAADA